MSETRFYNGMVWNAGSRLHAVEPAAVVTDGAGNQHGRAECSRDVSVSDGVTPLTEFRSGRRINCRVCDRRVAAAVQHEAAQVIGR